ncbi:MAG: CotH kinase family protein [Bacteroidota bacterium]
MSQQLHLFLLSFLLGGFALYGQTVHLNELSSVNTLVLDEDGDSPDWLELFNPTSDTVNLAGWRLTDDPAVPQKWVVQNAVLAPYDYLLVFASDKDRSGPSAFRTLVQAGDLARYVVGSTSVANDWRTPDFDDQNWASGPTGIGFGDDDDATVITGNVSSVLIRQHFTIAAPEAVTQLVFDVDYDDGFVAYLNGTEIARANMDGPLPAPTTLATTWREAEMYTGGSPERYVIANGGDLLVAGENVLAIQVHNHIPTSSDLSLIPFLTALYSDGSTEGSVPPAVLDFTTANFHTNFKLSSSGETLYLFQPDGDLADSLAFGPLPADVSIGRAGDVAGTIAYFDEISPAAPNPATGYDHIETNGILFSHPGGPTDPLLLTLSGAEAPALIRYTLDATEPTADSPIYTNPLAINENTVVRARIFGTNSLPSAIASRTYLVGVTHDLPIISLVTEPDNFFAEADGIYAFGEEHDEDFPYFGANFWEDWERPIHFSLYEADTLGLALNLGTKIFGGWSRGHAQRSLSFFARQLYGASAIEHPLFPTQEQDEYQAFILRNSGNDWLRTNFRDAMHTGLLQGLDIETQAYRPAAAYLNGEYWGLYNMREKVNEHFLAARHNVAPDEVTILERNADIIQGNNSDYVALREFIANNSMVDTSNFAVVAEQIDLANFALYHAAQIYWDNRDWPGNNIKYWRAPGGKWRWILFDTDFGSNAWWGGAHVDNTLAFALEDEGPPWPNPPWSTLLFRRLMTQTLFRNQFVNQLADLMNSRFLPAGVLTHIDTLAARISTEIPRHFERWGGELAFQEELIVNMQNFATQRPAIVKDQVLNTLDLPAFHLVTLINPTPEAGYVQLNTLRITEGEWQGDYFEEVPIQLTAIARAGYAFSHWTADAAGTDPNLTVSLTSDRTITPVFVESPIPDIVINEINYRANDDFDTGDWIELHNPSDTDVTLDNWVVQDQNPDNNLTLPTGTTLPAGGFLVLCRDREAFTDLLPDVGPLLSEEFPFGLSGNGDAVRLFDNNGELRDEVVYLPTAPWPTAANGQGPTLELLSPSFDNSLAESWNNVNPQGSPGRANVLVNTLTPQVALDWSVTPNPSTGRLFLHFALAEAQIVQLDLRDWHGRLLRTLLVPSHYAEGQHQFNSELPWLPSGTYVLRLTTSGGSASKLWVKQ